MGEGEVFSGEGILAVTKALLESGVSYVAGYQGAPISHLMDVLSDAKEVLQEHGIYFENSASEATAAATLAASVNYPMRGAVTFKATVGTNVASDALANLASGGVLGGALIIVGEDYGEGSSIMQERSLAFAMKSQIWLLDPRPNLPCMVKAVKQAFELSEASNTPVMLQMRIRTCHLHGQFTASDNRTADFKTGDAVDNPVRDLDRIVLPPASFQHEQEKVQKRWPAAVEFIKSHSLNEFFSENLADIGIIVQGGVYNTLLRVLKNLGLADVFGESQIPIYVMNVAYPVIDDEVERFCQGKSAVLMVEEGQPNFTEQNISMILRQKNLTARLHGKDILPLAGEYNSERLFEGVSDFLQRYGCLEKAEKSIPVADLIPVTAVSETESAAVVQYEPSLADSVHQRPPGFCTGCPERPIFTAMKLVERELGSHHVSADIGCHLFSILPPFNLGNTTMGYGLGAAGAAAMVGSEKKRAIAVMGDGGFWHNGLTSGIANAVFNKSDNLTIIVDNSYSAATGGQDLLSSTAKNDSRSTGHEISTAVKSVGVKWVRTVTHTYDLKSMIREIREALTTGFKGPKVLIAQSECMLNKQRRLKRESRSALDEGKRVVRERFGVDADTCTGDHSCIRLSGCPSLSIKANPDPLRQDPVATVIESCVGCGLCGEVSHAAVLCPSFYRVNVVSNPRWLERYLFRMSVKIISLLQRVADRRRSRLTF
ncbi:indolepyruvate ferredoxin oxidoreductase subunit alpha [Pseudomaricurvus hydrocarbonicus]